MCQTFKTAYPGVCACVGGRGGEGKVSSEVIEKKIGHCLISFYFINTSLKHMLSLELLFLQQTGLTTTYITMLKHNKTELGMFGSVLAHRYRVGGVTHFFLSFSVL